MTTMVVEIWGRVRAWASYDNIHVGIVRRADIIELVPGDAPSARHLGLRWGTVAGDGTFTVFRAAKLRFADVDASVVQRVLRSGGRLVASLGLIDAQGWPRCASVRPPEISWSAATA